MIVHEVVGCVEDFPEFREDHLFLALEMFLVEMRRSYEIGDELGDERQIACECPSVEDRLVSRGPGVETSADILDRFRERARVGGGSPS